MLRKEDKLVISRLAFDLLKSVHTSPGRYSEIFLKTPRGWGIGRLIVDRFSYYLYTTRPDEVEALRRLMEGGRTLEEAIACRRSLPALVAGLLGGLLAAMGVAQFYQPAQPQLAVVDLRQLVDARKNRLLL